MAPQEVTCNNATVRSCGKNLFNPESTRYIFYHPGDSAHRPRYENGIFYPAGTTGWGSYAMIAIPVNAGETYTLSAEVVSGEATWANVYLWDDRGDDGLGIGRTNITDAFFKNRVLTFTIPSGKKWLSFDPLTGDSGAEKPGLLVQLEKGAAATGYEPYYDGGEAVAPKLMCAADGSCQSTYDPQTGEFVNWWWDKITLNGSEHWGRTTYSMTGPTGSTKSTGFSTMDVLPERMQYNACWCNQSPPQLKRSFDRTGPHFYCGMGNQNLYAYNFGFYDDTLKDKGLANWKAHLAAHPLEIWLARTKPEITNIGAQPLTCPTGYGQIVQVSGDVPDCPMEVNYLAHGGHVK